MVSSNHLGFGMIIENLLYLGAYFFLAAVHLKQQGSCDPLAACGLAACKAPPPNSP